jgi:hypothetical protein
VLKYHNLTSKVTNHIPSLYIIDPHERDHMDKRKEYIEIEKKMSFSYDIEDSLTDEERENVSISYRDSRMRSKQITSTLLFMITSIIS